MLPPASPSRGFRHRWSDRRRARLRSRGRQPRVMRLTAHDRDRAPECDPRRPSAGPRMCYAIPAAIISPTGATICVSSRITWVIAIRGTPSATPGPPPAGSTGSGEVDRMASKKTVTPQNWRRSAPRGSPQSLSTSRRPMPRSTTPTSGTGRAGRRRQHRRGNRQTHHRFEISAVLCRLAEAAGLREGA